MIERYIEWWAERLARMGDLGELLGFFVGLAHALLFTFALIFPFAWTSAHYTAEVYSRISGEEVTTWEALWVDLDIQVEVEKRHDG